MSPTRTSRAAFATCPFDTIRFKSQFFLANVRVLKNRAAQSHASILTPVMGIFSHARGPTYLPSLLRECSGANNFPDHHLSNAVTDPKQESAPASCCRLRGWHLTNLVANLAQFRSFSWS